MTYEPPAGWIEAQPAKLNEPDPKLGTFHTTRKCERIGDANAVRRVDKPYSAVRCSVCART